MTRSRRPFIYLPEYLHEEPLRVVRALSGLSAAAGLLARARRASRADLRRDSTRNRVRRFGQALVLAAEWPEGADGCMRISSTRRHR